MRNMNKSALNRGNRSRRGAVVLAVVAASVGMAGAASAQTWTGATPGNYVWSSTGTPGWGGPVPNAVDASAVLPAGLITGPTTVSLDIPVQVGSLALSGAQPWTISGPETLSFASSTVPTLTFSGSAVHQLSAPVSGNTVVFSGGTQYTSNTALKFTSPIAINLLQIEGGLVVVPEGFNPTGVTYIHGGTLGSKGVLAKLARVVVLYKRICPSVNCGPVTISCVPVAEPVVAKFVPSNVSADPVVSTLEPSR